MGLFAILNVTLVTLSDELLLVLAFFRSAHLSCQNTLLYFSVPNTYLHKQSRYLLFGSAMLGLNTYSWIFPWYFANVLCHLSSRFTLVFIYTSDSNVSSQTFHMTYFPWFSPPFLQTLPPTLPPTLTSCSLLLLLLPLASCCLLLLLLLFPHVDVSSSSSSS